MGFIENDCNRQKKRIDSHGEIALSSATSRQPNVDGIILSIKGCVLRGYIFACSSLYENTKKAGYIWHLLVITWVLDGKIHMIREEFYGWLSYHYIINNHRQHDLPEQYLMPSIPTKLCAYIPDDIFPCNRNVATNYLDICKRQIRFCIINYHRRGCILGTIPKDKYTNRTVYIYCRSSFPEQSPRTTYGYSHVSDM